MRNKIFGAIGVLWGGGILFMHLFGGSVETGNDAYQAGQTAGLVMGGILFLAGLRYLVKK